MPVRSSKAMLLFPLAWQVVQRALRVAASAHATIGGSNTLVMVRFKTTGVGERVREAAGSSTSVSVSLKAMLKVGGPGGVDRVAALQ